MGLSWACIFPVLFLGVIAADFSNTTTAVSDPVDKTPGAEPLIHDLLPDNTLCGLQVLKYRTPTNVADVDEFPWVVALKYLYENGSDAGFRCSGTLIGERYVVTSADCVIIKGFTLDAVTLGPWNLSNLNDCVDAKTRKICPQQVILNITELIPHPFYSVKSNLHNIALLRLEQNVNYTDFVRAICLPPNEYPPPEDRVLLKSAGWKTSASGELSDAKLELTISMGEREQCLAAHRNRTYINIYRACIGDEGDKYTCNMSSGSPIMRTYQTTNSAINEEQFFQEGIVNTHHNCEKGELPHLFTRLSPYVNWILNNLEE